MKCYNSCPGLSAQGEQFDGEIFEISCSPHFSLSVVFASAEQSTCFVHICCHFSPSSLASFSQQLSQNTNFRSRDNLLQLKQTNNYCLYFTKTVFILHFFCNNVAFLTATEFMVAVNIQRESLTAPTKFPHDDASCILFCLQYLAIIQLDFILNLSCIWLANHSWKTSASWWKGVGYIIFHRIRFAKERKWVLKCSTWHERLWICIPDLLVVSY